MYADINLSIPSISQKFSSFRDQNLFIDCVFTIPNSNETVKCHRIILSNFSPTFKKYFTNTTYGESNKVVEIPFFIDAPTFKSVIDFMYTNSIEITEKTMINIFASAYMLNIPKLQELVTNYVSQYLDSDQILEYTKPFLQFKISKEAKAIFPDLIDNYENLKEASNIFSKSVARRFLKLKIDQICNSLTPYMMAHVLNEVVLTESDYAPSPTQEDYKLSIIDKYVGDSQLEMEDREALTNVIKWDEEDSYLYFVHHKCDWVKPSVSRQMISKVISNRRNTVHHISEFVPTLQNEQHHHMGVYSLFQLIVDSEGCVEIKETDLIKALGTLWGAVNQFNPSQFNLVLPSGETSCEMTEQFPITNIFVDDDDTYFLTNNTFQLRDLEPPVSELRAGIDFNAYSQSGLLSANIKVSSIEIFHPKRKEADNIKYNLYFIDSQNRNKIEIPASVLPNKTFLVDTYYREKITELLIAYNMPPTKKEYPFSLRISYIKIIGSYLLQ